MDIDIIKKEFISLCPLGYGDRNFHIFCMRYGLGGYEKSSYKKIGDLYNISATRVRGIIHFYLLKMRHPYRHEELRKLYEYINAFPL